MAIGNITNNLEQRIQRNFSNLITRNLQVATRQLSSGLRINRAADDAAGLQNANRLLAQLEGINTAIGQTQSGINLSNVADQGLESITTNLGRIRELSVKAGNGSLSQDALSAIQNEIGQNIAEINRIAGATRFGGNQVLNGDLADPPKGKGKPATVTTGSEPGQTIPLNFGDVRARTFGLGKGKTVEDIDVTQPGGVSQAIQIVNAAIGQVGGIRAEIGAGINRLTSTINSLSVTSTNLNAARSRIRDADVARTITQSATKRLLKDANINLLIQTKLLKKKSAQSLI